jgi:hypothetical protein
VDRHDYGRRSRILAPRPAIVLPLARCDATLEVLATALANKLARIAWTVLTQRRN